ncbi:MAG: hypothetical protein CO189_05715 [candidate division Zixibacteria bacterium CG_4_9_14_3_um_filter_46_8]|nr:MAG: hypothetical protein CO189_05715 [candidate division Zixibacteria bacterium CG_4_9_14_3_um_filter_46_8]
MRRQFLILIAVTIILNCFVLGHGHSAPVVAILDFDKKGDISNGDSEAISEQFRNMIIEKDVFEVMANDKIMQILEQQSFQLTGATETGKAVELGKLLNVNKLVTGSVSRLGREWTLSARIINIETGKIEISKTHSAILEYKEEIRNSIIKPLVNELLSDNYLVPEYNVRTISFLILRGEVAVAADETSYPDPEVLILHRKKDAITRVLTGDIQKGIDLQDRYNTNDIKVIGWTDKIQDSYDPVWNKLVDIQEVESGDEIWLLVYDRDITKHQYIGHVILTNCQSGTFPIKCPDMNSNGLYDAGFLEIEFK